MTKTFYVAKLNKNIGKYLAFTNTKNVPATASQNDLDYATFFETEDQATSAVEAYLNSPVCKMSKENAKFISIEPFDFEYDMAKFPFTNRFIMTNIDKLKNASNNTFKSVYLEYGDFKNFVLICTEAYRSI